MEDETMDASDFLKFCEEWKKKESKEKKNKED